MLQLVVRWYFENVFRRTKGDGGRPWYVDRARIGHFAVAPAALKRGEDASLFRLFITMAMYQARRDVLIMRQQSSMPAQTVRTLCFPHTLERLIATTRCEQLTTERFDVGCDVRKAAGHVDCRRHPSFPCHVKSAGLSFRRMGSMGKLPTSAWLHVWKAGGFSALLGEVVEHEPSSTARADVLVARLARVYRVGRKLATMFVSSLSVPALAPGLTPWFPHVDGNELVVVDTNVARAYAMVHPHRPRGAYSEVEEWIRAEAAELDLSRFASGVPRYSPRLLQQALYAFCSRSNRIARGDHCSSMTRTCSGCAPLLCPFASGT